MNLSAIVLEHLGVAANYTHARKQVTAGDSIASETRLLKWYGIHERDRSIPVEIGALARGAFTGGAIAVTGLGFVLLHRCGADFYFLIASTWRNENELWETVWYKDAAMTSFASFPRPGPHVPTFCVWELGPVCHEQAAWVRFLQTKRAAHNVEAWHADRFVGAATG